MFVHNLTNAYCDCDRVVVCIFVCHLLHILASQQLHNMNTRKYSGWHKILGQGPCLSSVTTLSISFLIESNITQSQNTYNFLLQNSLDLYSPQTFLHFKFLTGATLSCLLLRSSKNAFIMQSKSTFLEFFDVYSSLQICPLPPPPPWKILQGRNLLRMNDVISIEHMLCSQESSFAFCLASWLKVRQVNHIRYLY